MKRVESISLFPPTVYTEEFQSCERGFPHFCPQCQNARFFLMNVNLFSDCIRTNENWKLLLYPTKTLEWYFWPNFQIDGDLWPQLELCLKLSTTVNIQQYFEYIWNSILLGEASTETVASCVVSQTTSCPQLICKWQHWLCPIHADVHYPSNYSTNTNSNLSANTNSNC